MKKEKIVIVGAGSLFFGRQVIWAVAHLPGLKDCMLSFVDTDPVHLDRMTRLAQMVLKDTNTVIESTVNYREALPEADFVVLSFASNNSHFRRIECEVGARYGVRSCSGDTIGPAGIFHALREFPAILDIAHAIESLCPDAWLINYVNPAATMGIGLARHSKVKSFALCNTHHMPAKKESYLKLIGEDLSRIDQFDMRIAGVNHFTWMLKAELDGRDILPDIKEAFRRDSAGEKDEGYAKVRFNNYIAAQLADVFGAVPTCPGHTKEYLPYYQGRAAVQEKVPPLAVFDCDEREVWTREMWTEIDAYLSGGKPLSEFHKNMHSDHATDVINTMIVADGRSYFINCVNADCVEDGGRPVENLPESAYLELECLVDRNGVKPKKVGEFPLGLRSQQMLILDIHELTIAAMMNKDRNLLVRALSMDPLVNSIATAETLIDEIYQREQAVLPDWIQSTSRTAGSAAAERADETVVNLH